MQKTREQIVNILKMRGQSTVEELSQELGLTSVTVRHHMEILRHEGVVGAPEPLRRDQPGRPQYLYRLSDGAEELFPSNYDLLASALLQEMESALTEEQVDQMVRRIGERLAEEASAVGRKGNPESLDRVIGYLNELGYMVTKEIEDGRAILHFHNCPYKRIAKDCCEVCAMDDYMLKELFVGTPERRASIVNGDDQCSYVLPEAWNVPVEEENVA